MATIAANPGGQGTAGEIPFSVYLHAMIATGTTPKTSKPASTDMTCILQINARPDQGGGGGEADL